MRSVSRTHSGRKRTLNEDRVLDDPEGRVWAVADGMGGHSRGDAAAETVISALTGLARPISPDAMHAALQQAHRTIHEREGGDSGTTLVLVHLAGRRATIQWAGDSRAYLVRGGSLQLLTRDHSVVQDYVEAGLIDAEQSASHPQSHLITRAVGTGPELDLDTVSVDLDEGDRILLCSDGVSRSLQERDLKGKREIGELADRLLVNALQRDGSDNASLVLIHIG